MRAPIVSATLGFVLLSSRAHAQPAPLQQSTSNAAFPPVGEPPPPAAPPSPSAAPPPVSAPPPGYGAPYAAPNPNGPSAAQAPASGPAIGSAPPGYWSFPPPPVLPEPRRRWYGWQTLTIDGLALTMLFVAGESDNGSMRDPLIGTAVVAYFIGPPIVHGAHGHVGKALGSLGLRAGSAGVIAIAASTCDQGWDCVVPILLSLLSIPAAIAIDAAVLAREDVPLGEVDAWIGPWQSPSGAPGVGGGMRFDF